MRRKPTHSSDRANSIVERFGILDDIDYCYSLIDQRLKKLADTEEQLQAAEDNYRQVTAELTPMDDLLKRQRENVTFAEFVSSEGIKEIMSSISDDINALLMQEADIQKSLDEMASELKVDPRRKKEITEFYQARMKEFLDALNVHVLEASAYKTYDKLIKNDALGSDLPRSLLAQCFSFLCTMRTFNPMISCPLVLDSPLQQEQDNTNVDAIFKFIFSRLLPRQQLILSTLTVDIASDGVVPKKAKRIELPEKYGLLQKNQYSDVLARLDRMHETTLAAD